MTTFQIILSLMAFLSGVAGGIIGAYVGMKVGLAKLETWRELAAEALHGVQGDVRVLNEDSLVHDMEIGELYQRANMARLRRQRLRD